MLIEIDENLVGGSTVKACFSSACEAAPIERGPNGTWVLPQEPPYMPAETIGIGPGDVVRIVVGREGMTHEYTVEIPYETTTGGPCGGPVEFHPVVIDETS